MYLFKHYAVTALLTLALTGCSTREGTDFALFHQQTELLGSASVSAIEAAIELSVMADLERISRYPEEVETIILHRQGDFSMKMDSSTVTAALVSARYALQSSSAALDEYSLLLETLSGNSDTPALSPGDPLSGPASLLIGSLVAMGRVRKDNESMISAMGSVSGSLDSIATASAEIIRLAAVSLQSSYDNLAGTRSRSLITLEGGRGDIEEILVLNEHILELLGTMEILHGAWLDLPGVHEELKATLEKPGFSISLRIMAEKLKDLYLQGYRDY